MWELESVNQGFDSFVTDKNVDLKMKSSKHNWRIILLIYWYTSENSKRGIGGFFSQEGQPVAYFS